MPNERFKFSEMVTPPPAIVAFIVWDPIVCVFWGPVRDQLLIKKKHIIFKIFTHISEI